MDSGPSSKLPTLKRVGGRRKSKGGGRGRGKGKGGQEFENDVGEHQKSDGRRISVEGYPQELEADGDSVLDELSEAAESECAQSVGASESRRDCLDESRRGSVRHSVASFHSTDQDLNDDERDPHHHSQNNGESPGHNGNGVLAQNQMQPPPVEAEGSPPPDDFAPSISSFQQHVSCSTMVQNFDDRSRPGSPIVSPKAPSSRPASPIVSPKATLSPSSHSAHGGASNPRGRMSPNSNAQDRIDADLSAALNEKASFSSPDNSPVHGPFSGEVQIMSTPERTMSREESHGSHHDPNRSQSSSPVRSGHPMTTTESPSQSPVQRGLGALAGRYDSSAAAGGSGGRPSASSAERSPGTRSSVASSHHHTLSPPGGGMPKHSLASGKVRALNLRHGIRGRHGNRMSDVSSSQSPQAKVSPFAEFVQAPPMKADRRGSRSGRSHDKTPPSSGSNKRRGSREGAMIDASPAKTPSPVGGRPQTPMTGKSNKSQKSNLSFGSARPESFKAGKAFKHHIHEEGAGSDDTNTDSEGDHDNYQQQVDESYDESHVMATSNAESPTDSDDSDQPRRRAMRRRSSIEADNEENEETSESEESSESDQKGTDDSSDDDGTPYRYVENQKLDKKKIKIIILNYKKA